MTNRTPCTATTAGCTILGKAEFLNPGGSAKDRAALYIIKDAKILAEHSEIALLLTDVGLPGLTGRQLAEEARRRVPRLKVIYTTGYARNAAVHHGVLDAGVDLLAKPFTTDGLGRKMQEVLRRD
jgi:DNA-binding response OmpR family regulator